MADVAASPNDPIFINHHIMIDCIFEEWMKCYNSNNSMSYPKSVTVEGHRADDYMVPFFPVYTHSDMFVGSETFGYIYAKAYNSNLIAIVIIQEVDQWHLLHPFLHFGGILVLVVVKIAGVIVAKAVK